MKETTLWPGVVFLFPCFSSSSSAAVVKVGRSSGQPAGISDLNAGHTSAEFSLIRIDRQLTICFLTPSDEPKVGRSSGQPAGISDLNAGHTSAEFSLIRIDRPLTICFSTPSAEPKVGRSSGQPVNDPRSFPDLYPFRKKKCHPISGMAFECCQRMNWTDQLPQASQASGLSSEQAMSERFWASS